MFQIESLLDDKDFKALVTRAELEEMCSDIFERIGRVVEEALRSSEVTMARQQFSRPPIASILIIVYHCLCNLSLFCVCVRMKSVK